MIPAGASAILEARKRGYVPKAVHVHVDAEMNPYPVCPAMVSRGVSMDVIFRPGSNVRRADLRCVAGLPAMVVGWRDDDVRVDATVRRLLDCGANDVTVVRMWLDPSDERLITKEAIDGRAI